MANLLQQDRVDRDSLELCVAARLAREGEKEQKDREDQEVGAGASCAACKGSTRSIALSQSEDPAFDQAVPAVPAVDGQAPVGKPTGRCRSKTKPRNFTS